MSKNEDDVDVDRDEFYREINKLVEEKQKNNFLLSKAKYALIIQEVKRAKYLNKKTSEDYRRLKRFDLIRTAGGDRLCRSGKPGQMYVYLDEMYDIVQKYHRKLGHGGRTRMMNAIRSKYINITTQIIITYISLCKVCKVREIRRKQLNSNNNVPVKDTESPDFNNEDEPRVSQVGLISDDQHLTLIYSRGQIDLLDVTTSANTEYKHMMVYRDLATKFIHLKPLRKVSANSTVDALLEIFLVFGAPNILQSKNGITVTVKICKHIETAFPDMKIIAGDVDTNLEFTGATNEDILLRLNEWYSRNPKMKWQQGVKYVQYVLNTTFQKSLCRTPSEALFGTNPRKGLTTIMSKDDYKGITIEEELMTFLKRKKIAQKQSVQEPPQLEEALFPPHPFGSLDNDQQIMIPQQPESDKSDEDYVDDDNDDDDDSFMENFEVVDSSQESNDMFFNVFDTYSTITMSDD
ncbi:KRAB-A domain-containing protein 2-like [Epargyreus clarus]|uniref:KRAB-A domain-containing protein 2-like n=1 Tax=Epargyreus clarus TaxID=520877 RepID=UPI003C2B76AE